MIYPICSNQLPLFLKGELQEAQRLGIKPISPNHPHFKEFANGQLLNWVLTQEDQLLLTPSQIQVGKERVTVPHTVITHGKPVKGAGQAQIKQNDSKYIGLEISNHSKHYGPEPKSIELGVKAFGEYGIRFRSRRMEEPKF